MRIGLVCVVGFFFTSLAFAQTSQGNLPSNNWFNEDALKQQVNGVSTTEAYSFLKDKKSETVVVAIIDSGIDIHHEDLQEVIWINTDEIPGNAKDDDMNGYVDDIYGWNFLGGPNGYNVGPETLEVTREYRRLLAKYGEDGPKKKSEQAYWQEIKEGYEKGASKATQEYEFYQSLVDKIYRYNQLMTAYLDTDELALSQLRKVESSDEKIIEATNFMGNIMMMVGDTPLDEAMGELEEAASHYEIKAEYNFNLDYDPRTIIGDNPDKMKETGYGNNDVMGRDTDNFHGTHVAGIIAAKRDNGLGIDGIANNVKIMALRAVPDGDEYDKDVANAIRYAVDNGARIINMSFGKGYSPNKDYVDEAVKYAETKGVLLVHAAGNASTDIDENNNFPTKKYLKKGFASNWLEVGASGWGEDDKLAASFSNYGDQAVDVFAPGVQIYSTAPANEYKNAQGTSMASPVTAGVAALLLSYYPHLSATDVKDIIMQSSRKFDGLKVLKPGSDAELVDFASLSISGGIVNAYEAVKLAETWKIESR
jgi:cell wall-associated protease